MPPFNIFGVRTFRACSAPRVVFRREVDLASNPSITWNRLIFTSVGVTSNEDVLSASLWVAWLRSGGNRRRRWPEHCWAKRIHRQRVIIYRFSARKISNHNETFSVKIDRRGDFARKNATSTLNFYVVKSQRVINVLAGVAWNLPPSWRDRTAEVTPGMMGIARGQGSLPGNAGVLRDVRTKLRYIYTCLLPETGNKS